MPKTNSARNTPRTPLKAPPLRNPGQYLDTEIQRTVDEYMVSTVFMALMLWGVAFIEWISALLNTPRMPAVYAVLATIASIYAGYRFVRTRKKVVNLRLGRDGEKVVGQLLEELREQGAKIFHDVPGDGFNLDHVVICRQGIFAVETKTRSKGPGNPQITANGQKLFAGRHALDPDPIQQVRGQVRWLIRTLEAAIGKPLYVKGVLVFPGWYVQPQVTRAFTDLWVLEPKAFGKFIVNEPVRLSPADIALAAERLAGYIRHAPQ